MRSAKNIRRLITLEEVPERGHTHTTTKVRGKVVALCNLAREIYVIELSLSMLR